MSNFTLVTSDARTLPILVTDEGTLFRTRTRGTLSADPDGSARVDGDSVETGEALTFTVRIKEASEADGMLAIARLTAYAGSAQYLVRDSTGDHRALLLGRSLVSAVVSNVAPDGGGPAGEYLVRLTLLPMFGSWTTTAVPDLSGYLLAVAGLGGSLTTEAGDALTTEDGDALITGDGGRLF